MVCETGMAIDNQVQNVFEKKKRSGRLRYGYWHYFGRLSSDKTMSDTLDRSQFHALTYRELRHLQQRQVFPCGCEKMARSLLPTTIIKIGYSPITINGN